MTEKQEKILNKALELFAENGFDATSTSKVAKAAGVSEGLVFKHFKNKEGLLSAIMEMGKIKVEEIYSELFSPDILPKEILKSIITLPFRIDKQQFYFWKLLYALKWQKHVFDYSFSMPDKEKLMAIFTLLGYKDPLAETELMLLLIDGIITAVLLRKPENQNAILNAILSKYNL